MSVTEVEAVSDGGSGLGLGFGEDERRWGWEEEEGPPLVGIRPIDESGRDLGVGGLFGMGAGVNT